MGTVRLDGEHMRGYRWGEPGDVHSYRSRRRVHDRCNDYCSRLRRLHRCHGISDSCRAACHPHQSRHTNHHWRCNRRHNAHRVARRLDSTCSLHHLYVVALHNRCKHVQLDSRRDQCHLHSYAGGRGEHTSSHRHCDECERCCQRKLGQECRRDRAADDRYLAGCYWCCGCWFGVDG